MALPRVCVPGLRGDGGLVVLPADEAHHLAHVLRLGPGDDLTVFDGIGGEWRARVASVSRRAVTIDVGDPVKAVPEPKVAVTLAIGVLKGDQMDTVIRDAVALGVRAIAPLASAHVAVPARAWQAPAASERWRRVALAAARQTGRAVVPLVLPVAPISDVISRIGDARVYICVEPARSTAHDKADKQRPASAVLFVGPEGGWSDAEIDVVTRFGARRLTLGPRTLRAELAPIVALSALWTEWGW